MSDKLPPRPGFLGDDADEELVFDDFEAFDAPIVPDATVVEDMAPVQTEPKPKPRRASRRGGNAVETPSPQTPEDEAPVPIPSAEAAPEAAEAEAPAGETSVPFPPRGIEPAGSKSNTLLLAIVGLALLTSLLSLGGLIAVSRTLAHAGVARNEAEAEREALRRVPQLVQHLDEASARLDAATAKLAAAAPNGPPVSAAEVQHQLDMLKLSLDARRAPGMEALNNTTSNGFSELATRLDHIAARMDRAAPHP